MSAPRLVGLVAVASWLALGCTSSAKKIEVGSACILNSDCNSPLLCSMGKCHDACHATVDCPVGQSCMKVDNTPVCQLPAEVDCSTKPCTGTSVCASDLQCRTPCQSPTDCTNGQVCVTSVCADSADLKTNGQLPQKRAPDAGTDGPAAATGGTGGGSGPGGASGSSGGAGDAAAAGSGGGTGAGGASVSSGGGADAAAAGSARDAASGLGGAGGSSDGAAAGAGRTTATPDAGSPDLPIDRPADAAPDATAPTPDTAVVTSGDGGASPVPSGCGQVTSQRYFCEDFEAGLSKWTLSTQDWAGITSTDRSDGTSLTESPTGNYLNGENASATMAGSIDLTGAVAPVLTFWHRLALYCIASPAVCGSGCRDADSGDYGYVETSTDGGLTWAQLAKLTNMNNTSIWAQQTLDLTSYIGKKVKTRFRLWDDSRSASATGDGWYIDDIEIGELDRSSALPNIAGGCGAATTQRYFCDGFEAGLDNWTVSGKDWNTTTSSKAVSGSHSLADSPDGNYLDSANGSATLARNVDLAAATQPVLTFWHKLALDSRRYGCNAAPYDTAYVDLSTDSGLTWLQLTSFTYAVNTTTWSQQMLSLASYAGKQVKIRFRLWDNAYGSQYVADGWYIDDVEIRENL